MKKRIKELPVLFIFIIIFFVLMLIYIKAIKPERYGDGAEYMLTTVAFQNHFSFGVTSNDLNDAKHFFPKYSNYLDLMYNFPIVMKEYHNARYSVHYGLYSAFVAPVMLITRILNINPMRAFAITNWALWFISILVIFFFLKTSSLKLICIVLLSICNPVFFYLNWTHPEVFCYSFLIIGLVFYYNKEYGKAIFFVSFAAAQNLAINAIGMIIGIDFIISIIQENNKEKGKIAFNNFISLFVKKIIPYGLFYIPALLPLITTYLRFGTFNFVASQVMENKYLLQKALDYVFDLNLGILPFEPIILCFFIILAVIGIFKAPRPTFLTLVGVGLMLFIFAHQTQINCGMQFIMRYNIWIIPVLSFFVVEHGSLLLKDIKNVFIVCSIAVIFTSFIIYYVSFKKPYEYEEFAPWTKVVIEKAPWIYNPTHGIFYSRTLQREIYGFSFPVAFLDKEGKACKILLKENMLDDSFSLHDGNDFLDLSNIKKKYVDSGEYYYLNLSKHAFQANSYMVGEQIVFKKNENYNARKYILYGISIPEEWGTWTSEKEVILVANIKNAKEKMICNISIVNFFPNTQLVAIEINGKDVYKNTITDRGIISFSFDNTKNGFVCMKIKIPHAMSPSEMGVSSDNRKIALGIDSISIINE